MHLLAAIGISSSDDLDPTRPLKLGHLELGVEATAEAIRILKSDFLPLEVSFKPRVFLEPTYWSVTHRVEGDAEIFGFPNDATGGFSTAIETALVRAVASSPIHDHAALLRGGEEIAVGTLKACKEFLRITEIVEDPRSGKSLLFNASKQVVIDEHVPSRLTAVVISCLSSSLRTSPIKFRYIELYRMMETRFLADIKHRLIANFDAGPGIALGEATDALKSEMNQLLGLADTQQELFEACYTALQAIKNSNYFAAALFRRIKEKRIHTGEKWKTGAALVYQIRCAVVHSGEKDIIFESFPDGDLAIEAILPHVERAALRLVGIELI